MIVVRIWGGLGNQIFQYAAGKSVALKYQQKLLLDTSYYKNNSLRKFMLDEFRIKVDIATSDQIRAVIPFQFTDRFPIIGSRLSTLIKSMSSNVYLEQGFGYDNNLENLPGVEYLQGYWQSEKYFYKFADLLRQELQFSNFVLKSDDYYCQLINSSTSAVSVHVRRGDYISNKNTAKIHNVCDADYYLRSSMQIKQFVDKPVFFVFSDDIAWAEINLSFPGDAVFVKSKGITTDLYDLALMSRCRHHIIANSSFSWWGAWLNRNVDKIVVAPERWFADGREVKHVTPDSWIRC